MKVPTYKRQVAAPTALPEVGLTSRPYLPNAPGPEAFGAGLGRVLSQTGDWLGRVAERMQAEEDATRIVDAQNQLASWERGFFNDPEKGLFSRKNKDAVGLYDEASKTYEEKLREISAGLETDNQRMRFTSMASNSMNTKLDAVARYEAVQRQSWMAATAKQAMEGRMSEIAANYSDENIVSAAIGDVRASIEAMFPGMGQDFIDKTMQDFMSSAQIARIDAAVKADNPDLAASIYETHEEKIDGMKRAAVKAGIDKAQTSRFVQEESDRLYRKFGLHGEAEAMRWVREHYEGDKEDSLSRYIQARYSDERRFQAQREEHLFDATYNLVDGAGSLSKALEAIESSGMKRRHQASLRNYARETYAGEKLPQTSPVAATRIQAHLDDRNLFKKYPTWTSFYAEFGADLSFNDRNRYNDMYRQVEKSAGGPALTYSLHEGTKQIMSRYKVDYGSSEGSEIVEMSNAKIADEEQKLGRQLSYTEKVKIIEDQMKTHVVREKPFYWPNEKSKGYKIPLGYEFWRPFGQYVKIEHGAVWDIDGGKIGHIKGPYLYDESGKTLGKLEDSK